MINLLIGQPGGGKSYESVAFHVIPAVVEQGRKVITNLPLNLESWEAYFPGSTKLIEIRRPVLERVEINGVETGKTVHPFSKIEHFGDEWRHPKDGIGPLYIIDECHKPLPVRGTPIEVEEWFAEHRHELADVLLITQSYGKINKAIRDAVQLVYRVKKATAFGKNDRYIRKVQDGLRGEVVNTQIREYESKFFPLYKSHTKSNKSAQEALANDVIPIWKRWPFRGAMLCFIFVVCSSIYNLTRDGKKSAPPKAVEHHQPAPSQTSKPETVAEKPKQEEAKPRGPAQKMHPYEGLEMHLSAVLQGKRYVDGQERNYLLGYIQIAQNGQPIRMVSFEDLRTAGYQIQYESPTVVSMTYKGLDIGYVIADLSTVSMGKNLPGSTPLASKE
jgi:zona occludens toxin